MVAFRRACDWTTGDVIAHGFPSTEACLIWSDDLGQSWSEPRIFTAGNITNQNLLSLPNGPLILLTQRGEMVPLKIYDKWKDQKTIPLRPPFWLGIRSIWGSGRAIIQQWFHLGSTGPYFTNTRY
jgi:hypothetical protein